MVTDGMGHVNFVAGRGHFPADLAGEPAVEKGQHETTRGPLRHKKSKSRLGWRPFARCGNPIRGRSYPAQGRRDAAALGLKLVLIVGITSSFLGIARGGGRLFPHLEYDTRGASCQREWAPAGTTARGAATGARCRGRGREHTPSRDAPQAHACLVVAGVGCIINLQQHTRATIWRGGTWQSVPLHPLDKRQRVRLHGERLRRRTKPPANGPRATFPHVRAATPGSPGRGHFVSSGKGAG
jgi:hypothetical protein